MASVLVVTPQIEEAEAVLDAFRMSGAQSTDVRVGRMTCTALPGFDMLVAVGGNGKAQFAVQAQYLLDRCPGAKLLACVGAGGGLTSDVNVGDVVVATVTVEHDFKERFVPERLPRHEGDPAVLRELAQVAAANAFPFRVHFGPIASGDEDIIDASRATQVRLATDGVCVAWEGSGGARAARFSGVAFLEIRGITDAADAQAAVSFRQSLKRVVSNAAHLLLAWHANGRAAA
jgi:adenosylhomocysteine nucleosidase